MRHRTTRFRLTQKPAHSRLLQRNLVTSLLLYEVVRTTRSRAKVVQPVVDRLITIAKRKSPQQAIRAINAYVTDRNACRKIMEVLVGRYAKRPSGLTRAVAVGSRKGDGAQLVDLSLIDAVQPQTAKEQEAEKKTASKKKAVSAKKA
ncbi:TPA: 50S ribosomal protein L17 [Candidatus Peribacteria bacterium]|nr:MAG: 50S ribosomal protein L17 [Candidatus Peribacteria bacterium RIFOXYC2_FULL_58_10]OGJ84951.1 MAG: 50S ribosomal protein L17 [Candidatus Peribacteria bacterium RIFOXYD2_FULL_58_15]HAI98973.1 50S ribosomal protein L17 [Candidatus Peribacteria bacterium]HAS34778.1 50S ribosomal protein L17 [Candidatus Peribacteria bacterium]